MAGLFFATINAIKNVNLESKVKDLEARLKKITTERDALKAQMSQQKAESERLVADLRSKSESPIRAEATQEIAALRDRFRAEAIEGIRAELRQELRNEVRAEIRQEVLRRLSEE